MEENRGIGYLFNPLNISAGTALQERIGGWIQEQTLPYKELMAYYSCAMMEVETKFRVMNEEFSVNGETNPIETIKSRLKSPESILEKLRRKNLPLSTQSIEENLTDIAGIRVICSFQSDIYMLAAALLAQDDVELIERKDYFENPKPNGYRSLHLIIATPIFLHNEKRIMKVEVQLRTMAMDMWASLEHKLLYKKEQPRDAESLKEELKICADMCADMDARMERAKKSSAAVFPE